MALKEIQKEDFLDKIYELANRSRDEFVLMATQNLNSPGAILYVENAIINGQMFIQNYQCMLLGEATNPETTTYYVNEEGTPGFCMKHQFKSLCETDKKQISNMFNYDEDYINNDFYTEENADTKRIYG